MYTTDNDDDDSNHEKRRLTMTPPLPNAETHKDETDETEVLAHLINTAVDKCMSHLRIPPHAPAGTTSTVAARREDSEKSRRGHSRSRSPRLARNERAKSPVEPEERGRLSYRPQTNQGHNSFRTRREQRKRKRQGEPTTRPHQELGPNELASISAFTRLRSRYRELHNERQKERETHKAEMMKMKATIQQQEEVQQALLLTVKLQRERTHPPTERK